MELLIANAEEVGRASSRRRHIVRDPHVKVDDYAFLHCQKVALGMDVQ